MKKFKKQLSVFSILLFLFSTYFILSYDGNTFTSDNKVYAATVSKTVKVTSISLNKTKNTITVGGKETLKATVLPSNATNKKVIWSTSNSKVAVVSNGVVTAVGKGTANITVTTADGKKTAKYIVTVNPVVKVTSVKLNKTKNVLTIGKKDTLVSTVLPSNATNKGVTWSTSNSKVAAVSNGVVTAVGKGTANIKVTTVDGKKTASYSVTVNPVVQAAPAVKVTSIVLNKTFQELTLGEWDKLYAYEFLSSSNAAYQPITWKTSNSKVATVSSKGEVTTVASGTTVISATAGGKTAKCTITVKNPVAVKSIVLNKTTSSMSIGATDNLYANLLPTNVTGMGVIWKTSNSKVVTVTSYGDIKAVGKGTATITATTQDGSKSASCKVTVTAAVKVRSVALNINAITLTVGDYSDYLYATISPSTATNKDVTWKTSNSKVVTIEEDFYIYKKIRAVGAGTATITVTTKDGSKTSSCIVNVNPAVKAPVLSSITLNKTKDTLAVGTTDSLNATLNPYNTKYQAIGWITSNPKVALVNSNGNVTAVGVGKAVITATSDDGKKSASCTIIVNPAVKVKSVTLNKTTSTLNVGGYDWLSAIVSPNDATNQLVTWTTSNSNVATVSSSGYINAIGTGKATITATTVDGKKTATCVVTVNPPIKVTSVQFDIPPTTLTVGSITSIHTSVGPVDAANKNLIWSTSNSKLATVDSYGYIKGISAGKVIITATTVDGNKKATCTMTVIPPVPPVKVTGVALYTTSASLTVGNNTWLGYTVYPYNAANTNVTWSTSNSKVAAMDSSGNVEAISAGKATITVTTVDGKKTAVCNVTVNNPIKVTTVALNKITDALVVGNSDYLNAIIYPYNATNKNVMWTTSNSKVATVSSYGYVTAVAAGKATITAKTEDGNKVATCIVTVNNPVKVTSVELNKSTSTLSVGRTDYLYATVVPSDAADQSVIWTTSDSSVATVNYYGNVTAMGVGTATITATTEDGNKTATCVITVTN